MQQQILHLLCTAGTCRLHFSGHEHELEPGCCMIVIASHVGSIQPSEDCQLYRLLMPADWQANCMPRSSYGVCGWLHLFMHPIFKLEGDALAVVEHDFKDVAFRSENTPETYRRDGTVAYYAQELCVTPKHLHKVSTQVSGRTPSYWIQQFTVMEIKHLQMHGKLSAKEVASKLNFDNTSHFSRYLSRLGKSW